jgi:hypothetical protein
MNFQGSVEISWWRERSGHCRVHTIGVYLAILRSLICLAISNLLFGFCPTATRTSRIGPDSANSLDLSRESTQTVAHARPSLCVAR